MAKADEKNKSILSCIFSLVRDKDMFGVPIAFNYKGSSTFNTIFGGLASLVIYSIFTAYTVFLLNKMISKKTLSTTQNDIFVDLYDTTREPVYPLESDFMFGFHLYAETLGDLWDDISMMLYIETIYRNETTGLYHQEERISPLGL